MIPFSYSAKSLIVFQVLRLLNEHSGKECAVHLLDEWSVQNITASGRLPLPSLIL